MSFSYWWSECLYLWVDIQNADASGIYYLMDGLDLSAIEVTIIFTVFQVPASFDISFHLIPGCEGIHHILSFWRFKLSRGVCKQFHNKITWNICVCVFSRSAVPHNTTHREWWCRSVEDLTQAVYSSGFVCPLQVPRSEPASSCETEGLLPPPHRWVTHACQTLSEDDSERKQKNR